MSGSSGSDVTEIFAKGNRPETTPERRKSPNKCHKFTFGDIFFLAQKMRRLWGEGTFGIARSD